MKISTIIITYNHSNYIKKAIESVLNQNGNFEHEVIIANDNSTDNTHAVIEDVISSHPKSNSIKYLSHKNNIGMMPNFMSAYNECTGNYIALCEGDDFWTDELKLNKQLLFLENDTKYSACYTESNCIDENNKLIQSNASLFKRDLNQEDIFKNGGWYSTASLMFKNVINFSNDLMLKVNGGDRLIATLLTDNNRKIGYLKDNTCVYRKHTGGIYSMNSDFLKFKKIYSDFKLYKSSNYYKLYKVEINKKLSASLYVMGNNYAQKKEWKNYFKSFFEALTLISFKSTAFNFKMFVRNFLMVLIK